MIHLRMIAHVAAFTGKSWKWTKKFIIEKLSDHFVLDTHPEKCDPFVWVYLDLRPHFRV